jgi:hypothetical protein
MLMKTFAQHQPLTDAELDGLAEFLQSCKELFRRALAQQL